MKTHFICKSLLIGFLSVVCLSFDSDWAAQIIAKIDAFQAAFPQEKVYVHTDRPYYSLGETVWFKAYLVEGQSHKADTVSKICFAELVEQTSGKVIVHKKLKMTDAVGNGEFDLGDSLKAGNYVLRAYTNWMRNFDNSFYFTKILKVYDPKLRINLGDFEPKLNIKLFPEGGHILSKSESRIGVEVTNVYGKPVAAEGFVLNPAKDTLVGFQTNVNGLGQFSITADDTEKYSVVVKNPISGFETATLPKAVNDGFAMTVDNLTSRTHVRVFLKYQRPADAKGEFLLVAHSRGLVTYSAKGTMSKSVALVQIPKQQLAAGLTHITVFNENGLPECERLIYSFPKQKLKIELKPTTKFKTRGLAEFDVLTTNEMNQPVSANLSLAAVDANQIVESEVVNSNIASYFHLESDITGDVFNAAHLVDSTSASTKSQMDLVLLTKGWRRFTWKDVLEKKIEKPVHNVEQEINFTGKVKRPNEKPTGVLNLNIIVTAKDSSQSFSIGQTDEHGNFHLSGLDFSDTLTLFIQAVTQKGNRNLNISLENIVERKVKFTKIPFNTIEIGLDGFSEYLRLAKENADIEAQIRKSKEKILQEVIIKAKREKIQDSRKIYGDADATLGQEVLQYAAGQTVIDVLAGRVAGVQVSGFGQDAVVQIRGAANFGGVVEPLFLLDGMMVDKSTILSISTTDVESIDVLKGARAAIFGMNASGGAISVLTKRGSKNYDWGKELALGTLVTKIAGYAVAKEFASPDYSKYNPDLVKPDFRATIFWKPNLKTDANGKATVKFYLTDAKTNVRLTTEGMTADGRFGGIKQLFVVSE